MRRERDGQPDGRASKESSVIGIGMPHVDVRLHPGQIIPSDEQGLRRYINGTDYRSWRAGGIERILEGIAGLTGEQNVYLLGSVGNDRFGSFLRNQQSGKFGVLQINRDEPTRVITYAIDSDSNIIDRVVSADSPRDLPPVRKYHSRYRRGITVVDSALFHDDELIAQVTPTVQKLSSSERDIVALNLDGVDENGTTRGQLLAGIQSFTPNIIVGTQDEIVYLSGLENPDPSEALSVVADSIFPDTKLVVMLEAEEGELISFDRYVLPEIPGYGAEEKRSQGGFRDTWMGLFLGALYKKDMNNVLVEDLEIAALTASFGAARIAERADGRLTYEDFVAIHRFHMNPQMP